MPCQRTPRKQKTRKAFVLQPLTSAAHKVRLRSGQRNLRGKANKLIYGMMSLAMPPVASGKRNLQIYKLSAEGLHAPYARDLFMRLIIHRSSLSKLQCHLRQQVADPRSIVALRSLNAWLCLAQVWSSVHVGGGREGLCWLRPGGLKSSFRWVEGGRGGADCVLAAQ